MACVGILGNEMAAKATKNALQNQEADLKIPLRKQDSKVWLRENVQRNSSGKNYGLKRKKDKVSMNHALNLRLMVHLIVMVAR